MESPQAYSRLNTAWKQTTKVLFGQEAGELKEHEDWLLGYISPAPSKRKSCASGRETVSVSPHYSDDARFLSLDEVDFHKKFEPLNINEIKDMDSITESLRERFTYAGSVILENSKFVSESSNVSNSFYVSDSGVIANSKNVAYSLNIRYGENIFGVNNCGQSKFCIRMVNVGPGTRCFECFDLSNSSDCYYSFAIEDCADIMFSFCMKARRNVIGNLQLPPDKYSSLKAKLLSELNEILRKEKSLPSLVDLIGVGENLSPPKVESEEESGDMRPIEKAFGQVSRVVLGRQLEGIDNYAGWLSRNVIMPFKLPSASSGNPVCVSGLPFYKSLPASHIVLEKEGFAISKMLKLEERDLHSLDTISENLWKIAWLTPQVHFGNNLNLIDCSISVDSLNCYQGCVYIRNECCAYSFWPRNSKYVFGSENALSCNSCIKSFYSSNLSRCFEVDSSSNSSDLYFSHNCENVNDSMFTFNAKNLRYSIGNVQYPREDYRRLRETLLGQITTELEAEKTIPWSIYTLSTPS
ncbi:hypothetical protein JW721_04965 [Candidatus Micrarchaeota archaeon]|nr:hypothetical protein [Candidatus Micrarchaeota archaeon]